MEKNETTKRIAPSSLMGNCIPQETVIRDVRLAAAYVPCQKLCSIFSPIEALKRGTIFPELYSPYHGEDKTCSPFELSIKGKSL